MAENLLMGLLTGGVYALVALGLSLIFGVMKVINFAHGSFLMIAMFVAYWLRVGLDLDPYGAVIIVVPALFFLGYGVEKGLIWQLLRREAAEVVEPVSVLLLTTGLWLLLDNLALMAFKADYRTITTIVSGKVIGLHGLRVSVPRLAAFLAAIACTTVLWLLMAKTKTGRAMRATAQDREAAWIQGINVREVYGLSFGLGTAIVGIAGCFLVPYYYVHPSVGVSFVIKAFIVVVLGGMGEIWGALIGGLFVGVVESLFGQLLSASTAELVVFALFIAFLLVRPSGILGKGQ